MGAGPIHPNDGWPVFIASFTTEPARACRSIFKSFPSNGQGVCEGDDARMESTRVNFPKTFRPSLASIWLTRYLSPGYGELGCSFANA